MMKVIGAIKMTVCHLYNLNPLGILNVKRLNHLSYFNNFLIMRL